MAALEFLGAAETVTGSKYLLEVDGSRLLVDCGLFQGLKELRQRNWDELPVEPETIDHVLLTHGHIDHLGYLPRLLRDGFRGKIHATRGTVGLAKILLPDSGHLQEEEAAYHNRRGTSKHKPAEPLYTEQEGRAAAARAQGTRYESPLSLGAGIEARFRRAGHILGSAHVTVEFGAGDERRRVLFSGDIGRPSAPILPEPQAIGEVDYVLAESTYGDRTHGHEPIADQLEHFMKRAVGRGGAIIIPAFAVGRTQEILYHLSSLERDGRIPALPTYVDSPMAIEVTELYRAHPNDFDEDMKELLEAGIKPLRTKKFQVTRTPEESKAINRADGPVIIISASGMATGGRVLHHLRRRLPDPRTTVLLVGYQAIGTRGRRLQNGESSVRIFGDDIPVRASVETLHGLSAHADSDGILEWLRTASRPPREVFCVHGEPEAAHAMAKRIRGELGWKASVPRYRERVELA